ncbi:hypothetical protein LCGC14_1763960 [marine sediment metagenome]|uniref:Uncharacterized protein n=1 Tax=marine sediment metagenome TaxID=412755 RepID=A0A0F9JF73_9ZZZZ
MSKDNKIPPEEFNRGVKKLNAESVENTLLEILGKKMIGQEMTSSALFEKTPQFAENAFRMMATGIKEYALKNGLDPLPETVGAQSRAGSIYGDHTDWSAKVYAHFSLDPIRFIIFCAYQQDEMRTKLESAQKDRGRFRTQRDNILDIIRDSSTLPQLRGRIDELLPQNWELEEF